jgi:ubiquinone biosynthesis protein UbiJ
VKVDLAGCAHQVDHLERTTKSLRTEIDRLREKVGY